MIILAIDPGTTESAYVLYGIDSQLPLRFAKVPNEDMLELVLEGKFDCLVIEEVRSYGMPVGRHIFETVKWYGRFHQASPHPVEYIGRIEVKNALCHSSMAKDANVRQALLDRYGGSDKVAKGTKADPGPLYGMVADMWAALAVAETWADQQRDREAT